MGITWTIGGERLDSPSADEIYAAIERQAVPEEHRGEERKQVAQASAADLADWQELAHDLARRLAWRAQYSVLIEPEELAQEAWATSWEKYATGTLRWVNSIDGTLAEHRTLFAARTTRGLTIAESERLDDLDHIIRYWVRSVMNHLKDWCTRMSPPRVMPSELRAEGDHVENVKRSSSEPERSRRRAEAARKRPGPLRVHNLDDLVDQLVDGNPLRLADLGGAA